MSMIGGAAESENRSEEERAPPPTKPASASPASWALQFGITASLSSSEDTHTLMADPPLPQRAPPRPATADSSSGLEADLFSSAEATRAAASASSAASITLSPGTLSRSPQHSQDVDRDEGDWGENSFDDNDSSVTLKKFAISEASSDLTSLKRLMRQGSWRAIVDIVKKVKTRSHAPAEQMIYTTYHVLALMKLRNYAAAQDELLTLGDLNSPNFRFEKYPNIYASKSGTSFPLREASQLLLSALLRYPKCSFLCRLIGEGNCVYGDLPQGSMVPFGLRWLHAEFPHRLGQTSTTIDRLYDLLVHCNERIDFLHASAKRLSSDRDVVNTTTETPRPRNQDHATPPTKHVENPSSFTDDYEEKFPSGQPAMSEGALSNLEDVGSNYMPSEVLEDDDFGEFVTSVLDKESNGNIVYATLIHRWMRRQEVVLCSVLGHHLDQKNFIVCLTRLEDLARKRPQDVVVLSKYGYVQLQMGDLYGARRTFATIEAICEQQGRSSSPLLVTLLSRNRGLLYFSLKQYTKAVQEFDVVLEIDPGDIVSANNKALCLMYSRDLVGATQVLETVLQSSPITTLNETLVLNLCSMYELASMNSVESKKTLSAWILRIAPDDFDLACTRL